MEIKDDNPYCIAASFPRFDAPGKVTGNERFSADYYRKDMLWAGVKMASIPHAIIRSIDTRKAGELEGVVKILTHRDVKGTNRFGVVRKDQPVLVDDKIRHCGDPIALVIAKDREIIRRAIELMEFEYQELPPVCDTEDAIKPDAPLIHEDNPEGNILLRGHIKKGMGKDAFNLCDHVVEAEFFFGHQEHAYLETECGWAVLEEDGMLEIVASTQTPFRDRLEVSEALGIDIEKVRIIAPFCGGAFGGKDGITVQCLLGLGALNCPGRPIKMWLQRDESIISGSKRHAVKLFYRLGADKDGIFKALETRIYYDTGAYDHLGGAVMTLGLEHSGGPYRIPNTELNAWSVYTNNPIGGAFRGFGVPQVIGAMEQVVDMLAEEIGISPIDIRLKNAIRNGDKTPVGATLKSSAEIIKCINTIKEHPFWKSREEWKSRAGRFKARGVGVSAVLQGMGYGPVIPDKAEAKVELTDEGIFRVYAGVVDMGQGNASTYVQIAGTILNQTPGEMELILPDTEKTLPSGSSSASRTTYTYGNALILACKELKKRIIKTASLISQIQEDSDFILIPGAVRHRSSQKEIPLYMIAEEMTPEQRLVIQDFTSPVCEDRVTDDEKLMLHGMPHRVFSYGAHLACVEVDKLTGEIQVKKYLAVTDCGNIINPQVLEQQIHGGISQGIGYALYEEFIIENAEIKTKDLSTYIIPCAMDIPAIESITVEADEETGPFGLKGAGEVAMNGPLPAISNAIYDACGIRVNSSPITPEKIISALSLEQKGGALD